MMMLKLKRAAQSSSGWRRTRASSSSAAPVVGPMERVECVVVGSGVVGLAVARELSVRGREVMVVVDAGPTFGTRTSSRSSEVVHAGIYYPPASYKAAFCVRGRELLYRYCSERGIPHEQIGKLIVATSDSEVPKLCDLMERGRRNGVVGLEMIDGSDAAKMELELRCVKALHSPISRIVDSHSMLSLVGEAESHGATLSYNSTMNGGNLEGDQPQPHVIGTKCLQSWDGKSPLHPELTLLPKLVVNSAGLSAIALARRFSGLPSSKIPPAHFARGCYFTLSNTRTPPFDRLIYPMPEDGGIGVHVTLDLVGQVKFGPNIEWIDSVDDVSSFLNKYNYSVNPSSAEKFYAEIRKYYPNMNDGSLEPGYAGIRPKIYGPKQPPTDFIIQGEDKHQVPGLVNLFRIESPGLTSSLAIAEHIAAKFLK